MLVRDYVGNRYWHGLNARDVVNEAIRKIKLIKSRYPRLWLYANAITDNERVEEWFLTLNADLLKLIVYI